MKQHIAGDVEIFVMCT